MKRRTGLPHLEYRPSGYLWRRRYPRRLEFDLSFALRFSLHTHDPVTARDLAAPITRLTDLAFEFARVSPMQAADMHHVITELVRWKLHEEDLRRARGEMRTPAQAAQRQRELSAACETLRHAIELRDYSVVQDPIRHMLDQLGYSVEEGSPTWRELGHETARAMIDTTREIARRDRGEFDEPSVYFRSARAGDRAVSGATSPISLTPEIRTILAAPGIPVQEPRSDMRAPHEDVLSRCPKDAVAATEHGDDGIAAEVSAGQNVPTSATPDGASETASTAPSASVDSAARPAKSKRKKQNDDLSPNLSVSEIADRFLAHRKEGKSLTKRAAPDDLIGRTNQQMENERSTAKLLKLFFGARKIGSIDEDDCVEFFNVVQRLPASYGKSSKHSKMDPRDIAKTFAIKQEEKLAPLRRELEAAGQSRENIEEILERKRAPLMSANTVYRKMQETKRIFQFAKLFSAISDNPMDEVIWEKNDLNKRLRQEGDRARKVWGAKLPRLFRTPHFQNWSDHPEDPLIWACLIGVFSGAREEEILQLKVEDFDRQNGKHFFHIRAGSNQHVKSEAGTRKVPIHDKLIELGLLDLLERRRQEGAIWLFAGLERGKNRNKFSSRFTKDFTDFRKKCGLYEQRMDFHSFRKEFNENMLDARISAEFRRAILGHENNDVNTRHYSDGFPFADLHEAVNSVSVDVSMLRNPFTAHSSSQVTHLASARERMALANKS